MGGVVEKQGERPARVCYQRDGEEIGEGFEEKGFADRGAVLRWVGCDSWVCGWGLCGWHFGGWRGCLDT